VPFVFEGKVSGMQRKPQSIVVYRSQVLYGKQLSNMRRLPVDGIERL
jgi:hypothetical protein